MHRNEELARREIELIEVGDLEAVAGLYTSDFVLHYPGRSPLAGTHRDVRDFVSRLESLLEGWKLTRTLHDAFGTDDHAVQLLEVTAESEGRSFSWRAVIVMHLRDGRFSEAWFHFEDQYALDEFLSSLTRS